MDRYERLSQTYQQQALTGEQQLDEQQLAQRQYDFVATHAMLAVEVERLRELFAPAAEGQAPPCRDVSTDTEHVWEMELPRNDGSLVTITIGYAYPEELTYDEEYAIEPWQAVQAELDETFGAGVRSEARLQAEQARRAALVAQGGMVLRGPGTTGIGLEMTLSPTLVAARGSAATGPMPRIDAFESPAALAHLCRMVGALVHDSSLIASRPANEYGYVDVDDDAPVLVIQSFDGDGISDRKREELRIAYRERQQRAREIVNPTSPHTPRPRLGDMQAVRDITHGVRESATGTRHQQRDIDEHHDHQQQQQRDIAAAGTMFGSSSLID